MQKLYYYSSDLYRISKACLVSQERIVLHGSAAYLSTIRRVLQ